MDIAILILVGLLFWAFKTRRRSVRVVIFSIAGGAMIGAVAYPVTLGLLQLIWPGNGLATGLSPYAPGSLGWLLAGIRIGAGLGLLIGVFVGFARILPPRRPPGQRARRRVARGRSR